MEYSMEFHGTLVPPNDISLCSMEFHGTFHGIPWSFGAAKWHITKFHGIPWSIPWNSMELCCRQMTYHLVPWNSMELWHCHFMEFYPGWTSKWYSMEFQGTLESSNKKNHRVPWDSLELRGHHFKWHKYSMEFHGTFHGIPWNFGAAKWHITKFHGIPWNIPWNFMELWCRQMKYDLLPWNSMELWDRNFMAFYPGWISKKYSMEFHGTLESPNKKSPSSMRFHGIKRAPLQMTQVFHGIPWNIPWNSMELWCRQMTYHLVAWNSMEHSMEFHGTLVSPYEVSLSSMEFHGTLRLPFYGILPWLDFHGIFHGIPWNPGVAKQKITEFHGIPCN